MELNSGLSQSAKQRQNPSSATQLVEDITWELVDSFHRNLANGNCPWLGEAGNLNVYNVRKTDSPYF